MREDGPAAPAPRPDLPRRRPPRLPNLEPGRPRNAGDLRLRPPVPGGRPPGSGSGAFPDSARSGSRPQHRPKRLPTERFARLGGDAGFRAGAVAAAVFALGCGTPEIPPPPPQLASLTVAGPEGPKELVPRFDPAIRHYAVRCAERETLTVAATAERGNGNETANEPESVFDLFLNGAPLPAGSGEVSLAHDQDLSVEIRRGAESATYAVHCVPLDFPEVSVVTLDSGLAEGLLLLDPWYESDDGDYVGYLAALDDHGVPRFLRRVEERAWNFRRHPAHRLYSYASLRREDESCSYAEVEIVLLDDRFAEVDRLRAVGLCNTDLHDFLITPEGNHLFLAYVPAERDFSAVPDEDGDYPWATTEATHDSVIQEVTPEGEVVFQWNSGEPRGDGAGPPLKMTDCRVDQFPDHYAWLNSLTLTGEGNLLASFRGCAQVLEIERPSGRVLRQLGGSAPAIPDGRVHHRFVGDPVPGGFCGQHTPIETGRSANGDLRLALFDNGNHCPGGFDRPRSRVVEYRLGDGEAVFLRHYESLFAMHIAGSVQALANGNWLVTWGWGGNRPQTSLVEVDPSGREVLKMHLSGDHRAQIYRAYREPGLDLPLNLP